MNLFDNFTNGNRDMGEETPKVPCNPDNTGNETDEKYTSLAMVYSPKQAFGNLFTPEIALEHGTLFADLDKPFLGYIWEGED